MEPSEIREKIKRYPQKQPISPARRLVQIVWDDAQKATDHSRGRLNEAMYGAVRLAIEAGLEFDEGDFDHFCTTMRMRRWSGQTGEDNWYKIAVEYGNLSACHAIEAFLNRPAFILDGHRIHVGYEFSWKDEDVTCTSIDTDILIACSYSSKRTSPSRQCDACSSWIYASDETKVKKRYRITVDDLRARAKAIRDAEKAMHVDGEQKKGLRG